MVILLIFGYIISILINYSLLRYINKIEPLKPSFEAFTGMILISPLTIWITLVLFFITIQTSKKEKVEPAIKSKSGSWRFKFIDINE